MVVAFLCTEKQRSTFPGQSLPGESRNQNCQDLVQWDAKWVQQWPVVALAVESKLDAKYLYMCHAKLNAVMNNNWAGVKGYPMYATLFPCNECAKLII